MTVFHSSVLHLFVFLCVFIMTLMKSKCAAFAITVFLLSFVSSGTYRTNPLMITKSSSKVVSATSTYNTKHVSISRCWLSIVQSYRNLRILFEWHMKHCLENKSLISSSVGKAWHMTLSFMVREERLNSDKPHAQTQTLILWADTWDIIINIHSDICLLFIIYSVHSCTYCSNYKS